DRRWLEAVGSDDSHGRSLLALGACVSRSRRRDLQFWASRLFDQALPAIGETTSPRGWASSLIRICLYLERFGGARPATQMRDALADRLIDVFERTADDDWPWFENILSYDNAMLPHALIAAGRSGGSPRATDVGLRALSWLVEQQKAPSGCFRPIGSNGFYRRGRDHPHVHDRADAARPSESARIAPRLATARP